MGRFSNETFENYYDLSNVKWLDKVGIFEGRVKHAYSGRSKNGKEFIKLYAVTRDEEHCGIDLWFSSPQTEAASVTNLSKVGINRQEIIACEELNQLAALIKHRSPVVKFETEGETYTDKDGNDKTAVRYKAFSFAQPKNISINDKPFEMPAAKKEESVKETVVKEEPKFEISDDLDLPF